MGDSSIAEGAIRHPPGVEQELASLQPQVSINSPPTGFSLASLITSHDKFLCGICAKVLREPVQTTCGHRYVIAINVT